MMNKDGVQECYFPLSGDLYFTKCIFRNEEYFHIRKFININNEIKPTKTGVVLKRQQIKCLKNILNRMDLQVIIPVPENENNQSEQTTHTIQTIPSLEMENNNTAQASDSLQQVQSIPFSEMDKTMFDFPADNEMLLKAALDAEKRRKSENRFFY